MLLNFCPSMSVFSIGPLSSLRVERSFFKINAVTAFNSNIFKLFRKKASYVEIFKNLMRSEINLQMYFYMVLFNYTV